MTTNSGPSTPTPLSDYTQSLISTETSTSTNRAYRTFKRKFPNHPFTTKPGTAKEYIDHPKHRNTQQFLQTNLHRLTTAQTLQQFIYVGFKKLLKEYTAPRANDFSIEYYDHNIIRSNHDQFLDDDRFANPQLTEKFFISTPYIFTINIFDKRHDHII